MKINNPLLLSTKRVVITRDISAAAGLVAHISLGFKPTSLHVIACLNNTMSSSIGIADRENGIGCVYTGFTGLKSKQIYLVVLETGVGAFVAVDAVTYDADGFTLSWLTTGGLTGTAELVILASR